MSAVSWRGHKGRGVRVEPLCSSSGRSSARGRGRSWSGSGEPAAASFRSSSVSPCVGDLEGRCDEKSLVDLVDECFMVVSDQKENRASTDPTDPGSLWASLVAQTVKNPPAVQEIWVPSLGWEDPLEK